MALARRSAATPRPSAAGTRLSERPRQAACPAERTSPALRPAMARTTSGFTLRPLGARHATWCAQGRARVNAPGSASGAARSRLLAGDARAFPEPVAERAGQGHDDDERVE